MQERTLFVSGAPSGRCTPVGILDGGALSEMLSNYSGWAYGVRWHATPAPLCASCVGLALAAGSERVRRLGWIGLVVSLALGTASAVPGTLDPWTPSTQEEYSVIEVVSGEPVYVKEHLDAARLHLSAGRPQEARYQAEHALRRNPAVVPAWRVAIAASKRLDDVSRLRSYVERLGDRESLDPDVRERLVKSIEAVLESDERRKQRGGSGD